MEQARQSCHDESIMSPKNEHERELNQEKYNSDVNTDLFYKNEDAFYAFAARSSITEVDKNPIERHAEKFMHSKAIPAKTLNLKTEAELTSGGRRRTMTAGHTTRNPTGRLRLMNYRQI